MVKNLTNNVYNEIALETLKQGDREACVWGFFVVAFFFFFFFFLLGWGGVGGGGGLL